MDAPTQALPQTIQPVLLGRLVAELDRAQGRGLIVPVLRLTLLIGAPALAAFIQALWLGQAPMQSAPVWLWVLGFLFAPVLQTVLLRFCLHWLGKVVTEPVPLSLVAAVVFGLLHGRTDLQTLALIWAYYAMGVVFLRLQVRSLNRAYGIVILLHALYNTLAYGVYLLG